MRLPGRGETEKNKEDGQGRPRAEGGRLIRSRKKERVEDGTNLSLEGRENDGEDRPREMTMMDGRIFRGLGMRISTDIGTERRERGSQRRRRRKRR